MVRGMGIREEERKNKKRKIEREKREAKRKSYGRKKAEREKKRREKYGEKIKDGRDVSGERGEERVGHIDKNKRSRGRARKKVEKKIEKYEMRECEGEE